MKQTSLGLGTSTKRTRRREFLDEMDRVVPWSDLVAQIAPFMPEGKRGRPPFPVESLLRIHTSNRVVDYCIRVDGETVAVDPKPGVLDALAHGKEVEHGFVVAPGEHHVEIDVAYADGSISSSYRTYTARGRTCTRLGLDGNDSLEDCAP